MLRWGVRLEAATVSEAGAFLLSVLQKGFQEKDRRFCTPFVIMADRYFPEARKQLDRVTVRDYGNCDGCVSIRD